MFDYLGQLREEYDLQENEAHKAQPNWMVTAPTPAGTMRTTYDAAPYDPPMPSAGAWASARSPYAFSTPQAQQSAR